jgi:hypothetical protein
MQAQKNNWLNDFARNVTSSGGEDGIVEKIFEIIGAQNKWCVELGALNGTHDSNVWNLINNHDWSSVLLEADKTYFEKLSDLYKNNEKVTCLNMFVSFEGESSLDSLFSKTKLPKDFDMLSLDIDGNDYHLWDSLKKYEPRIVVIEFNPTIPNDIQFVQPRNMSIQQGSSLLSLAQLGKQKNYELVAVTYPNAFFVKKDLFPKFGIANNSLNELHKDHQYETRLFQLYDGTLKLVGYDQLFWHKKKINEEDIQVLPKSKRVYPAGISSRSTMRDMKYFIRKLPVYTMLQRIRKFFR